MMKCKYSILIGLASLLLGACSEENRDFARYVAQVKQRDTQVIPSLPVTNLLPGFKFPEKNNRRNPFKPATQKKQVEFNVPDPYRIKQPLEAYPLKTLKFVGTLAQDNQIWALIQEPDSHITRVCRGNYIGQHYGRILTIKKDSLKLEEMVKGSLGMWEKHITTLDLNNDK